MYKKNDEIELTIEDVSVGGEGIGHSEGIAIFVKGAVIGDKIIAGITKVKKNMCYARIVDIIIPSPYRSSPRCDVSMPCGGCQLQSLSYDKQLELKSKHVRDSIIRIGGFDESYIDAITTPIIGMDEPYHYRNKLQLPIGRDRSGAVVMGFFLSHSHDIVPIDSCALSHPSIDALIPVIRTWIEAEDMSIYRDGRGILRHVLIRVAASTGELMVCIVGNADLSSDSDKSYSLRQSLNNLADSLSDVAAVRSVVFNENQSNTNVILGANTTLIRGSDTIRDYIGDKAYDISAESFYQVNPIQTKKLYDKVLEYCALSRSEHIWDLYCGIGTIGLYLSDKAASILGIEVVPRAVEDAISNAALCGVDNASYIVGRVEDIVSRVTWGASMGVYEGVEIHRPDIIILDPPRKGCDETCLNSIRQLSPDKIIYVSCNPSTLARDLQLLYPTYKPRHITPIDMFPQTGHVETVCLLSNRKPDAYVHIDVDLEDYYKIKDSKIDG